MQPDDKQSVEPGNEVEYLDLSEEQEKMQLSSLSAESTNQRWFGYNIEALWRRRRRALNALILLSTILLAILLLNSASGSTLFQPLFDSFLQTPQTQGTLPHTTSDTTRTNPEYNGPTALLRATPPGPIPASCPPASATTQNSQQPLPVKIVGFENANVQVHLQALKTFRSNQGNLALWGTQLLIEEPASSNQPIVWLHFSSLDHTHAPVFGTLQGETDALISVRAVNDNEITSVALDPSTLLLNPHASRSNGLATALGPDIWRTIVYFSNAGCYRLDVSWLKGHWQIVFASGK